MIREIGYILFYISLILIAIGIILSIKTLIDMIIYNECLNQEPAAFINHPVCKRYKDY